MMEGVNHSEMEKFGDQKNLGQEIFGSKISHKFWSNKIKGPKNIGFKRLVKIGSVIAEIFLMWTNVARTIVAWTNVTMTAGICQRWSREPTFEV